MDDDAAIELLGLTKRAMSAAQESLNKARALEAVLKQYPDIDLEYQKRLRESNKQNQYLNDAAAVESLEKRLAPK
jgi:hypothetical protein